MNTEGTAVEHELGRPVLLSMHASASAAFALGALVVLAVSLPVALALHRLGPRPNPTVAPLAVPASRGAGHGVACVGIVLGLTIGAEMAAQMGSARFIERLGAGAAFFAGFQAVVRLLGDALRRRLGDQRVIRASLVIAALGFVTVASSSWSVQSLIGFALVGPGAACVVPCCFALIARRAAERAAAALGIASLVAGAIRLPTPLVLGAMALLLSCGSAN